MWRFPHALEIGITNPDKKCCIFTLEPVRGFDARDPFLPYFRADIEQHSQVGLQVWMNPRLECGEFAFLHAATAALIGKARVREAIAQYAISPRQRRPTR